MVIILSDISSDSICVSSSKLDSLVPIVVMLVKVSVLS